MRTIRGRTWGKIAVLAAIGLAGVITVASCTSAGSVSSSLGDPSHSAVTTERAAAAGSGGSASDATAAGGNAAAESKAQEAAPNSPAEAGAADSSAIAGLSAAPVDGSKVIRTADLTVRLRVEPVPSTDSASADRDANAAARSAAVAQAAGTVRGIAIAAGGFQATADGGGSQITVSLRVPTDQYDAVMDKLTALGDMTARSESSQDVTAQVADVNSRVESMTASVARVRALLAQATTIADVISIESELSVREANLESLQQQQAALGGQVAMSTISLGITAMTNDLQSTEPVNQDNGFITGLNAGWAALVGFAGWLGGVFGVLLPFLPLIAGAVLLGWWLLRRTRRRRAATAATPSAATSAQEPAPAVERVPEPSGAGAS
jgi:Domain of unknown function (DUF4349)